VQLSVRGFLFARFLAMLAWAALLVTGYFLYSSVAPHLPSGFLRWVWNIAVLAGTIWLGFALQRRTLQWLDPDGTLRHQVSAGLDDRLGVDE